jgi:hypothetical protein
MKSKNERKNSDQAFQISKEKQSKVIAHLNLISRKEKEATAYKGTVRTIKLQTIIKELDAIEALWKNLPEDVKNWIERLRFNCLKKLNLVENVVESDDPEQWDCSEIDGKFSLNGESASIQGDSKFYSDVFLEESSIIERKSFLDSFNQMVIEEWGTKEKGKKKMLSSKVRLLNKIETE